MPTLMSLSARIAAEEKLQGKRVASVNILLNLSPKSLCKAERALSPTPTIDALVPSPSAVFTVSRTSRETAEFTPPQSPLSDEKKKPTLFDRNQNLTSFATLQYLHVAAFFWL